MELVHARSAVLTLLAACSLGTTVREYTPAQGPAGAMLSVELTNQPPIIGELLAVEQTSVLLLDSGRLVRVGIPLIRSGKGPQVSFTGATLDAVARERLRLISRYPQGVSPDLEARLLKAYGVTEVREVS
jgi:hypothetical protein